MSRSGGCSARCRCSRPVHAGGRRGGRRGGRGPGGAAPGGLLAAGPAAARPGWPVPVLDAGDAARLRDGRLLAEAGEQDQAAAALAGLRAGGGRAGRGRAADQRPGKPDAARWLDAEDATMRQVLAWAHGPRPGDRAAAGRRAGTRGGSCGPAARSCTRCWPSWPGTPSRAATGGAPRSSGSAGQRRSRRTTGRGAGALHRAAGRGGGPAAVPGAGRRPGRPVAGIADHWARIAEAADDARRALAVAREVGYPLGEVRALLHLAFAAAAVDDVDEAVRLARQAEQFPGEVPPCDRPVVRAWR